MSTAHLTPIHTVLLGANAEALGLIPQLLRDPRINLIGMLPTHPDDLIHHLAEYGYRVTDPCPVTIYQTITELAALPKLDLIIDTTLDPGTLRELAEAGLAEVARVNASALPTLLAQPRTTPPPTKAPTPKKPTPTITPEDPHLTREVGRAYRHGRSLGLVTIRIIHDSDELLEAHVAQVSQAIEQSLRIEDILRYESDGTFVIILPETGYPTRQVVDRLTSNLAALRIRKGVSGNSALQYSVGWAWFPQDAKTASALLAQAKARMSPPKTLNI